jgi:hypothetical protein
MAPARAASSFRSPGKRENELWLEISEAKVAKAANVVTVVMAIVVGRHLPRRVRSSSALSQSTVCQR